MAEVLLSEEEKYYLVIGVEVSLRTEPSFFAIGRRRHVDCNRMSSFLILRKTSASMADPDWTTDQATWKSIAYLIHMALYVFVWLSPM